MISFIYSNFIIIKTIFREKVYTYFHRIYNIFDLSSGGQGYTGKFQGMDNESYAFLHQYRFYIKKISKFIYFSYVTFTK